MQIKSMRIQIKKYLIKVSDNNTKSINNPSLIFDILKGDYNPIQEELYLIVLNQANNIIDKILISKGEPNQLLVMPATIFSNILLTNGNSYIMAHNHPSGNVDPSQEDKDFTRKLKKAGEMLGFQLLDHIIFSDEKYFSFKKDGIL